MIPVDIGIGDRDSVRLVVDAVHSVAVGLDGEDQRGVSLAQTRPSPG
jgi:hypothetical protein